MSRYHIVVTRPQGVSLSPEFGEVLLEQVGAEPVDLERLLNDGWVRLRLDADFRQANAHSQLLEAAGAVVEIIGSDEVTPPPRVPLGRVGLASSAPEPVRPVAPEPVRPVAPEPVRPVAPEGLSLAAPVPLELDFGAGEEAPAETAPPERSREQTPPAPDLMEALVAHGADDPGGATPIEIVSPRPRITEKLALVTAVKPVRCRVCGATLSSADAACASCDARQRRPPSVRARLRERKWLRLAVGFAIALGAGRVVSAPYERHLERRVAALELESATLRVRLDPEVQSHGVALAEEAQQLAGGAAVRVALLWLLVAALAFALWLVLL